MDLWDHDVLDLDGPAHFTFESDGFGSFQFIAVSGEIDYRVTATDAGPRVEFSWEGTDEGDHRCGRGCALVKATALEGRLYFHNGDDSSFVAERMPPRRRKARHARLGA
ncbi:MAG: hypothetical protein ACREQV_01670 [Candidatus Binatia bacterium]